MKRATMSRLLALSLLLALAALIPGQVSAAPGDDQPNDFLLRVRGDAEVPAGQVVGSVIVIKGDAIVDGTVTKSVVVIDGSARVRGRIGGDITVINGTADLGPASQIKNLNLIRSDLVRAAGATVTGHINERQRIVFRGAWLIFGVLFWAGMTIAVVVTGLGFAAVGGRQLNSAAETLTNHPVGSIVGMLVVCIGLPVAAFLITLTIVGLPLGLGIFLLVLPALWLLGYVTVGTRVGLWITGAAGRSAGEHPYLAATVGLVVLQIALLVPGLGPAVVVLGGAWGAGGLVCRAWQAARGTPAAAAPQVGAAAPSA